MKTLYLECNMGAAGDMLTAALLELHENPSGFLTRLNGAGIPGVTVTAEPSVKCGIAGTHIKVTINGHEEHEHHDHHAHNHTHGHNSFHEIGHTIGHLNIPNTTKQNALEVYKLIARAESDVHGVPVSQIHFHEVGELDAVADIVGVCMLIDELAPERIIASPVNTGSGQVRCAHGILPVPSPAAAVLLQNIPIYSDGTTGELCTPTGAALLKYFTKEFRAMPVMTADKIGYGMGRKDFKKANCVRAFLGESETRSEEVTELVCHLDDMTPEAVAFAQQLLFEEGALDVTVTPTLMKKGRTGSVFACMCRTEDKDKLLRLLFKHTTTLGIREYNPRRYTLERECTEIQTDFGIVRVKTAYGFGVRKTKPEYEDIAKIARERGMSVQDVLRDY